MPDTSPDLAAAPETAEQLQALRDWERAYLRTDLVARLGFATLADYRGHGVVPDLPAPVVTQLDRYEQALLLEEAAHTRYENARGAS